MAVSAIFACADIFIFIDSLSRGKLALINPERRIGFRRAVKQAVGRTMRMGAKGIKVTVSGRLGGAEIARSESYRAIFACADIFIFIDSLSRGKLALINPDFNTDSTISGVCEVDIDILEIKSKDMSAILVGEDIASQLERRIGFRRAVKQASLLSVRSSFLGLRSRRSPLRPPLLLPFSWRVPRSFLLAVLKLRYPVVSVALKSPVVKVTVKVLFRCRHCVQISTMR